MTSFTKDTIDAALLHRFVQAAQHAARTAGEVLRPYFRHLPEFDTKTDQSPVSIADEQAERAALDVITREFPDHAIWAEESGKQGNAQSEYVWTIDPLDGTRAFLAGIPTFTVLIGLTYQAKPLLGVVYQPMLDELWLGLTGAQTTLNGQPANTRKTADLSQAILSTTSPELFDEQEKKRWNVLASKARMRVYGADAYAYAALASGGVDVVLEAGLKPHDFCPLVPIIQGAGGCMTDWQGNTLTLHSSGQVLATTSDALLEQCLAVIA